MSTKIYVNNQWVEIGSDVSLAVTTSNPADETNKTISVKKITINSVNKDDVTVSDQEQSVLYDVNIPGQEV